MYMHACVCAETYSGSFWNGLLTLIIYRMTDAGQTPDIWFPRSKFHLDDQGNWLFECQPHGRYLKFGWPVYKAVGHVRLSWSSGSPAVQQCMESLGDQSGRMPGPAEISAGMLFFPQFFQTKVAYAAGIQSGVCHWCTLNGYGTVGSCSKRYRRWSRASDFHGHCIPHEGIFKRPGVQTTL